MPENHETKPARIHPYSAGLLIVIDNVFFGSNLMTLGLATPAMAALAFAVTGTGVFLTQRFLVGEEAGPSLARGFVLGTLAGVPTSLFGTGAGVALLARSGISRLLGK